MFDPQSFLERLIARVIASSADSGAGLVERSVLVIDDDGGLSTDLADLPRSSEGWLRARFSAGSA